MGIDCSCSSIDDCNDTQLVFKCEIRRFKFEINESYVVRKRIKKDIFIQLDSEYSVMSGFRKSAIYTKSHPPS